MSARTARRISAVSGCIALAAAFSPWLDRNADSVFAVHMLQHLLLLIVAPPLFAFARADMLLLRSIGRSSSWSRLALRHGHGLLPSHAARVALSFSAAAITLWSWHIPAVYEATLVHPSLHVLEHFSFFGSAFVFWRVALAVRGTDAHAHGLRVLAIFAIGAQGSLLGALLTFAGRPLYPLQTQGSGKWGLSALADQQLAGQLMWVPPLFINIVLAAFAAAAWLDAAHRQRSVRDRAAARAAP